MTNPITSKTTNTTLSDLPLDVSNLIFSMLDVPSVCRLYVAFSESDYAEEIAQYLTKCKVEVTAETVITGDTRRIDFDTLAKLPPCDIVINVKVDYMRLTLWYLKQSSYRSVALNINQVNMSATCKQANLLFLGTKLSELSLIDGEFKPTLIPASLTKLKIWECSDSSTTLDLRNFTNLTHFWIDRYSSYRRIQLPQSITDLYKTGGCALDASTLPNLRRFGTRGDTNTTLPWSQLESAQVVKIPPNQRLDQMKEITVVSKNQSFKDIYCPRLESVEYGKIKIEEEGDEDDDDEEEEEGYVERDSICAITELFTDAQLARLIFLKGRHLSIGNINTMRLLQQMKVLHITVDKTLTESFPLPPNLVELVIWSSQPVQGIPHQLEVFEYCSTGDYLSESDVVVRSANLKRLKIDGGSSVIIDCDRLTDLCLKFVGELPNIHAPNLMKLENHDLFGFPFKHGFPRLAHVKLGKALGDVVIEQHLKSIKISDLKDRKVSISADTVVLGECKLLPTSKITAKKLQANSLVGVRDVTCQELACWWHTDYVPAMVEKLTIGNYRENLDADKLKALELYRCTKLRYLSLDVDIEGPFVVPSSVKQLKLSGKDSRRCIKIETQDRLEWAHVDGEDDAEFTQTPVSVFVSSTGGTNFVPEFFTSLKSSKKHRLE